MGTSFTSDIGINNYQNGSFDKQQDASSPLRLKIQPTLPMGSHINTGKLQSDMKKPL